MKEKELCFIIENKKLYLEHVLVDYMDIPIFFLCKGEEQYYIALCTDIEELHYIVTKLSLMDVYDLLHGEKAMRDIILKQKEFWKIYSEENIASDKVIKCDMNTMDQTLLPEADAKFEVLTKDMEQYVKKFDQKLWSEEDFTEYPAKLQLEEVCDNSIYRKLIENTVYWTDLVKCEVEPPKLFQNLVYETITNYKSLRETTFRSTNDLNQYYFAGKEEKTIGIIPAA